MGGRKSGSRLALIGQGQDVAFYVARVPAHATVLVLGFGQGRLVWDLAARGHRVVAVDPFEWMVRALEAEGAGRYADLLDRVEPIWSDLRSLRLDRRFPAVIAPHNALGSLGTPGGLDAALATVANHLEPSGTFLCDVAHPAVRSSDLEDPHRVLPPPRRAFILHLSDRGPGAQKGRTSLHRLRRTSFTAPELERALAAHGLLLLERYGGFDAHPFEPKDSVQVVLAEREPGPDPAFSS